MAESGLDHKIGDGDQADNKDNDNDRTDKDEPFHNHSSCTVYTPID
jgi:hypothetical protein